MSGYTDQILGSVSGSESPDQFSTQIEAMEKQLRKMKKRKKGKKAKKAKKLKKQLLELRQNQQRLTEVEHKLRKLKKKKRGKKGKTKKKLNKRLRTLEQEREQLKQFICFAMNQYQMPTVQSQSKPWWQDTLTASVPKILDLVILAKSRKPIKVQPPLALPAHQGHK